jgi:hypothetical protein
MNRPLIDIPWDKMDELLRAGCTGVQCAAMCGMHPDTFYTRTQQEKGMGFTEYSTKRRSEGISLIQRQQYLKALGATKKGDNTMLVWLGKNLCGQKENPSEHVVAEEVQKAFDQLMQQLVQVQAQKKAQSESVVKATNSSEAEQKSVFN